MIRTAIFATFAVGTALAALLHSGLAASADKAAGPCSPATIERGKLMFNQCAVCHSVKAGDPPMVGPNLFGVMGRKAASAAGVGYSRAMRESGIIWTYDALNTFLSAPQSFVPGTQMGYAGMKQPQDRASVICFLGSPGMAISPPVTRQ